MKKFALLVILLTAVAAQADLKTWLHGAPPPPPTPGPPDAEAASVAFAPTVSPDKQIPEFMQAFAEAMRIHDGKSLQPRLSDRYEIEDLPDGHNAIDFFLQAMVKVRAPEEIVITAIEREGEARLAKMEFRSTERGTKERTFKFDPDRKLRSADFFTLKRQQGG